MKIHNLSINRLKELLSYDSDSGVFTWNVKRKKANEGDIAGHLEANGYIRISIDGERYQAHQLAWLYANGCYLADGFMIDHIDRARANNSIANLRVVSNQINQRNANGNIKNTSGTKGVTWNTAKGRWQVTMRIGGKRHYFGYFKELTEAVHRRAEIETEIGGWL